MLAAVVALLLGLSPACSFTTSRGPFDKRAIGARQRGAHSTTPGATLAPSDVVQQSREGAAAAVRRLSVPDRVMIGPGTFADPAALDAALGTHGVDTTKWGAGDAKGVEDLWVEIEAGECILIFSTHTRANKRPVRTVRRWLNVVKVRVVRPPNATALSDERRGRTDASAADDFASHHLIELCQVFLPEGRSRARGRPLSEKVFFREAPLAAARRGLSEELGPAIADAKGVVIDPSSLVQWRESRESLSYPTLNSYYNMHQFDAEVGPSGLPRGRFSTVERLAGVDDDAERGRLAHIWEWHRCRGAHVSEPFEFRDLAVVMWR